MISDSRAGARHPVRSEDMGGLESKIPFEMIRHACTNGEGVRDVSVAADAIYT